jgi:hypothetical protein
MTQVPEAAPKKEKRRIVPTLIGPPTTTIFNPPPPAPAQERLLLEKQTILLGPSLVHKVATGRAQLADFEARVRLLNDQGGHWTVERLLEETGVKTMVEYNRHIKAWLDKWEPLARIEDENVRIRHKAHRSPSKRSKRRKRSKSRKRSGRPRRGRPPLPKADPAAYRSSQCLGYSVATSRAFARSHGIPLGRNLRRKAEICAYIQSTLTSS